jgi:hypothetical protein
MRKTIATLTLLAALTLAPSASAAFGDRFGLVPINGPGAQTVPAFPDQSHMFWAGTCDTASAPTPPPNPGDPAAAIPGGIGGIPPTILGPNLLFGFVFNQTPVPSPATPPHCVDWGASGPTANFFNPETRWNQPSSWRLPTVSRAGAHPDGTAAFAYEVDGSLDNIQVDLPPGFAGNPNSVAKCTAAQFAAKPLQCPPESQVGVMHLLIRGALFGGSNLDYDSQENLYPIYNLEPRQGNVAELGFGYASGERALTVRIVAKARTNSDFGVTTFVGQIPAPLEVFNQEITLWGVPWAASNDKWRAPQGLSPNNDACSEQPETVSNYIPPSGFIPACAVSYRPSWGKVEPFVSNPTECSGGALNTRLATDSYQHPGGFTSEGDPALPQPVDNSKPGWKVYDAAAPAVTDCGDLGFAPSVTLEPTKQGGASNQEADSPSGLDVELTIPQNDELPFDPPAEGSPQLDVDQYLADAVAYWKSPAGTATSHLRDTVVALPEGMTLNPAAADGQGACTMGEIGVTDAASPEPPAIRFNNQPVACPDSSKVGEVVVETPLLDEADWPTGDVYLAKQAANPFGSDFAIYIAVRSPQRGLIVKLAGRVDPDPATGRIVTTFADNPQLPFDRFRLRFKAGPRAPLATPSTCGAHDSAARLTPYSDPGSPVTVSDPFQITSSPAGGCPASDAQRPLNVGFSAGSTELVAGASSPFTVRLTRPDGNQELDRIEVTTPEGLAAKLAGVPSCSEAGIAQAISRTAAGDGAKEQASPSCPAASQVGTTTIGAGAGRSPFYVGGKAYLAGPYKGAPVSLAFVVPAVAGPFDLGVQVVRTALQVNPRTAQVTAVSDKIPTILRGVPLRIRDVRVDLDRPGFTVNPTDCAEQQVTAKVYGASGAATSVANRFQIAECARLGFKPKLKLQLKGSTKRGGYPALKATLTARPGDANIARTSVALPHSEFLAQEHIRTICTRVQFAAHACPAGSIYGKATAISPLLDEPLSGPVYLRSSDNPLPDLVAALRGPDDQPIEIELAGRTDSKNEGIRNTFDLVPDAPVSKFTLEMQGGKKGLLLNSTNVCRGTHKATVKFDAQNGRKRQLLAPLQAKCGKAKKKTAQKRPVAMRALVDRFGGLL